MSEALKEYILARIEVDEESGCWVWQRAKTRGYGTFWWKGKQGYAHRWAWLAWRGELSNLVLDHAVCDNPPCCNPDHLEPKTNWENVKRSETNPFALKSRATHCHNGHPFTDLNTYIHPTRETRDCRKCARARKIA